MNHGKTNVFFSFSRYTFCDFLGAVFSHWWTVLQVYHLALLCFSLLRLAIVITTVAIITMNNARINSYNNDDNNPFKFLSMVENDCLWIWLLLVINISQNAFSWCTFQFLLKKSFTLSSLGDVPTKVSGWIRNARRPPSAIAKSWLQISHGGVRGLRMYAHRAIQNVWPKPKDVWTEQSVIDRQWFTWSCVRPTVLWVISFGPSSGMRSPKPTLYFG